MKRSTAVEDRRWQRRWQWTITALAALVLSSCRATPGSNPGLVPSSENIPAAAAPMGAAAGAAVAGQPIMPVSYDAAMPMAGPEGFVPPGAPLPCPGGQLLPLPYDVRMTACHSDELLCDGGDHGLGVMVSPDWKIYGLDPQDTIAHYDTLDGRTLVAASSCVCLYAPRFGAVRSVARIAGSEQIDMPNGIVLPVVAVNQEKVLVPGTSTQPVQPQGEMVVRPAEGLVSRQIGAPAMQVLVPVGFHEGVLPYEKFLLQPPITLDADQKARLAQAIEAAIAWSSTQGLQVALEGQPGSVLVGDRKAQATFVVEDLRHSPKLCVMKVASTQTAQPGDVVDFTIRFDNVGDQPLGNIVLADNLTPRLEYMPDSAQSSVKADFSAQPNSGGSVVLRWEIREPLEPNQGGLVRFRCKVR